MSRESQKKELFEDHALCDRFIFSAKENTLLITPLHLNPTFLKNALSILNLKNVINFVPAECNDSICEAILKDKNLMAVLKKLIKNNRETTIESYANTREFSKLINSLKRAQPGLKTPSFSGNGSGWTTSYFGSKSGFRQTITNLDYTFANIPKYALCRNINEVIGWVHYFYKHNKDCVLKTNRGLAGAGLLILKQNQISDEKVNEFIKKNFEKESYWKQEITVVEEFIEPDLKVCGGAPNIELKIENKKVTPLYTCAMRINSQGAFKGVEIGKMAVPKNIDKKLITYGQEFGELLINFGFSGYFEIDFVCGINRKVYPLEANTRRTGGTHVYELGVALFGDKFIENHYFVSNNLIDAPKLKNLSYDKVKKVFAPLLYPIKNQKKGLILTVINLLPVGQIGYIVVGSNKKQTQEIENQFFKLIT